MGGTALQYPLYACTVTVTTSPQSLLALIRALGGKYSNCSGSSQSFQVQPDPNNGTNILIGDENVAVSPQQCMANLQPASGDGLTSAIPYQAPIGSVYVVAAGAGASLLNVAVFE